MEGARNSTAIPSIEHQWRRLRVTPGAREQFTLQAEHSEVLYIFMFMSARRRPQDLHQRFQEKRFIAGGGNRGTRSWRIQERGLRQLPGHRLKDSAASYARKSPLYIDNQVTVGYAQSISRIARAGIRQLPGHRLRDNAASHARGFYVSSKTNFRPTVGSAQGTRKVSAAASLDHCLHLGTHPIQ